MVEDQIIAYTFEKYLNGEGDEWPLLLPMIKSAVRAMDAVQEFCRKEWDMPVKQFTVTGRLEARLDDVADRGGRFPRHGHCPDGHRRAQHASPDEAPVGHLGQVLRADRRLHPPPHPGALRYTRRAGPSTRIVDPYTYRSVLTQPKWLLLGTNDRYWPLDALNVYWDGLAGDKYVTYVPNNGHGLKDMSRVLGGVFAVHRAAAGQIKLPKVSWELKEEGGHLNLSVRSDPKPKSVLAWTSASASRRLPSGRVEVASDDPGGRHVPLSPERAGDGFRRPLRRGAVRRGRHAGLFVYEREDCCGAGGEAGERGVWKVDIVRREMSECGQLALRVAVRSNVPAVVSRSEMATWESVS